MSEFEALLIERLGDIADSISSLQDAVNSCAAELESIADWQQKLYHIAKRRETGE